jgi:hypothetical protein
VADLETLRDAYRAAASEGESIHLSDERWERLACGELSDEELEAAHDHILSCPECSDIYRTLAVIRTDAATFDPGAPVLTPDSAEHTTSRRGLWGGLGLLAMAAAVMLVMVLPTFNPDAPEPGSGPQQLRSTGKLSPATLVGPVDESVPWSPDSGVIFRWRLDPVAPAVVEILDADGELVWTSRATTATAMAWPPDLTPTAGRYYWRVVVTGAGDKKISSELAAFRLTASRP